LLILERRFLATEPIVMDHVDGDIVIGVINTNVLNAVLTAEPGRGVALSTVGLVMSSSLTQLSR